MFEGPRAAGAVTRVHETTEGHDDHAAVHARRSDTFLYICISHTAYIIITKNTVGNNVIHPRLQKL